MPQPPSPPLILFAGATARWACQTGRAANVRCIAADLFGDRDTREAAETTLVLSGFSELPDRVAECNADGVVLLGGLENHPSIVQQIAETTEVLGCSADSLEKCLDPAFLGNVLGDHFPVTRRILPPRGANEQWLRKPIRSAGGQGVRLVPAGTDSQAKKGFMYQRLIAGRTLGAVFVGAGHTATFVGATEQLSGAPFHNSPFAYGGSIGPIELDSVRVAQLLELANELAVNLDIRGLFGFDFIVDLASPEPIVIVDVNLRPTASCEILQIALGKQLNLIELHLAATRGMAGGLAGGLDRVRDLFAAHHGTMYGKAIVYWEAEKGAEPIRVGRESFEKLERELGRNVADIPDKSTSFKGGQPVVTLLTEGNGADEVLQNLISLRKTVLGVLHLPMKNE